MIEGYNTEVSYIRLSHLLPQTLIVAKRKKKNKSANSSQDFCLAINILVIHYRLLTIFC